MASYQTDLIRDYNKTLVVYENCLFFKGRYLSKTNQQ